MASTKRVAPEANEPEAKKTKLISSDSTASEPTHGVKLNTADCDLDFNIEPNGLIGHALFHKGFAYCWSGARANIGIRRGKYCFGCKVAEEQIVIMDDTPDDQQHLLRVGISRGDNTVSNLGETPESFGYGGTGKFSSGGKFLNYGEKFEVGDTIVCAVDLDRKPLASLGFSKNGKWLGIAKEFDAGKNGLGIVDCPVKKLDWESALFPHVLLKNVIVKMQFSAEDGLVPVEGYKPWSCAVDDGNAIVGPVFGAIKDCEVMMMVGLPASGKTSWAEKWVKEHPEKRYLILGTNLALDQMRVPGLLRKQNYGERFDRLMARATDIFNTVMKRATETPRNFIIDQTNVFKSARKRKMIPFSQFRKIAVVVFPTPDELRHRAEKRFREMGKEVPEEAVNQMLANYVLPTSKDMPTDESFDQVMFTELNREEARTHLEEMKRALKTASVSPYPRESSVKSFASSSPQTPRTLAAGGHQRNSRSPLPPQGFDNPRHQQVNLGYSGQSQYASAGSGSPTMYKNYGGIDSYGTPNSGSSSFPAAGGHIGPHHGYRGIDSLGTPDSGRSFLPVGSTEPYQSHGGTGAYGRPNFDGRNPVYRSDVDPQWSHGGRSNFASDLGGSRTSLSYNNLEDPRSASQVPRERVFDPRDPLSTSYGPPYGTPHPRLPYGNVPPPGRHQYEEFSSPPGRRYY